MARSKRTLAEADMNAPAPAAKRASRGNARQGKENNAPTATIGGKKAAKDSPAVAKPATGKAAAPRAAATKKNAKLSSKDQSTTWICVCVPPEDPDDESNTEADREEDADEGIEEGCGAPKCLCKKPADDHPEHKWILTKAGYELYSKWDEQKEKRDQDNFDMHIYEDFTGYGVSEVMQNMLVAFDKEWKSRGRTALTLWPHIESMAFFLQGEMDRWRMNDDSEGNADLVALLGCTLLTTLDILISNNLFTKTSSVRNLGLILSQWLGFTQGAGDEEMCPNGQNFWKHAVIRLADKHAFEITGTAGIEDYVKACREDDPLEEDEAADTNTDGKAKRVAPSWKPEDDYDEDAEVRVWKEWDWKIEFALYCTKHRTRSSTKTTPIGGTHFDITKMPKAVRKRYELSGDLSD